MRTFLNDSFHSYNIFFFAIYWIHSIFLLLKSLSYDERMEEEK